MEDIKKVVHGVCPAMVGDDDAAIVSVSVRPDGTGEVLCVRGDIKSLPDMVATVADLDERYGPAPFIVETNGVQVWLAQALSSVRPGITVKPLLIGADHRAVFGVAAMVHAVRGGQLTIASGLNEDALIRDILNYNPSDRASTRLMALWLAYRFATIPS